jgi:hypothetical protein
VNKPRALRLLLAVAVLAAIVVALHVFDPIGLIRRLHGMD